MAGVSVPHSQGTPLWGTWSGQEQDQAAKSPRPPQSGGCVGFFHVLKSSGNTCAHGALSRCLVVPELVAMLAVRRPFPLGQGMLQEAVSPIQAPCQATSSEERFTCVASNARRQLGLGDSAGRLLMDLGSSSCPKYHT